MLRRSVCRIDQGWGFVVIAAVVAQSIASAPAQVPAGWYVVSSFQALGAYGLPAGSSPFPGAGGLWVVHPRTPGIVIPVTGLPPDLVAGSCPVWSAGASSVLLLSDGRLAVGEVAWGTPVDLHLITLNAGGASVATSDKVILGNGDIVYGGAVRQTALLPDGRVLVAVVRIVSGVLGSGATSRLGIVRPAGLSVEPFDVIGLPDGEFNALAVDGASWTAYVGIHQPGFAVNWIYRVPLDESIPPFSSYVQSIPATNGRVVTGLCLDNLGNLVVVCRGAIDNFFSIDLESETPSLTPLPSPSAHLTGVALESETGGAPVVAALPAGQNLVFDATGTLLGTGPFGGCASGIAVASSLKRYGPKVTAPTRSLTWQITPNPAGLPIRGNTAFGVTIANEGVLHPGIWCLSTAPQNTYVGTPTGWFWILVDISQVLVCGFLSGLPLESIPLPIPDLVPLEGSSFFLQCMHLDLTVEVCASRGLAVTII